MASSQFQTPYESNWWGYKAFTWKVPLLHIALSIYWQQFNTSRGIQTSTETKLAGTTEVTWPLIITFNQMTKSNIWKGQNPFIERIVNQTWANEPRTKCQHETWRKCHLHLSQIALSAKLTWSRMHQMQVPMAFTKKRYEGKLHVWQCTGGKLKDQWQTQHFMSWIQMLK